MTRYFLANAVLVLHAAFIGFVVFGLILVWIGFFAKWRWVRNPWFRILHLFAIGLVVAQSWLGMVCPLTTLENFLRERAGEPGYSHGFIADWLHRLIFFQAEPWVFTLGYTLFGLLVLMSWILCPVEKRWTG